MSGSIKQHHLTAWEAALLPLLAEGLGLKRYHLLHPSVIYQGLASWWDERQGLKWLLPQLDFGPLPVPFPPLDLALPESFVAVGFYGRHTWPLSEEHRMWVMALVEGLAKHVPVVLLESGLHTDDHVSFPIPTSPKILSLVGHVTLQNNLAMQSAVLAKARCFVGTYGGTMQLAVRLRKPAFGVYQHFSGTAYAHKVLTEWLGVQQQTPVWIGRPDDARFVREVMQVL